jgi:hypothetical protein
MFYAASGAAKMHRRCRPIFDYFSSYVKKEAGSSAFVGRPVLSRRNPTYGHLQVTSSGDLQGRVECRKVFLFDFDPGVLRLGGLFPTRQEDPLDRHLDA